MSDDVIKALAKSGYDRVRQGVLAATSGALRRQAEAYYKSEGPALLAQWEQTATTAVGLAAGHHRASLGAPPLTPAELVAMGLAASPALLSAQEAGWIDRLGLQDAGAVRAVLTLEADGARQQGILHLFHKPSDAWSVRMTEWLEPFEAPDLIAGYRQAYDLLKAKGYQIESMTAEVVGHPLSKRRAQQPVVSRAEAQPEPKEGHKPCCSACAVAEAKGEPAPCSLKAKQTEASPDTRLYHVIVVNDKTRKKTYMTRTPEPHDRATVLLRAQTRHPQTRALLEEVGSPHPYEVADGYEPPTATEVPAAQPAPAPLGIGQVKEFIKGLRTYMDLEKQTPTTLHYSTRDDGDVGDGKPGEGDIAEAKHIADAVRAEFGSAVSVTWDGSDEWTSLEIRIVPEAVATPPSGG